MKVHNRGKFHQYSICGCSVKKKKFCVPSQDPRISPFWRLLALTPPIWSNIAEILTRRSTLTIKNTVLKMSGGDSSIYGKGTDPKLALLVQLLSLFSS